MRNIISSSNKLRYGLHPRATKRLYFGFRFMVFLFACSFLYITNYDARAAGGKPLTIEEINAKLQKALNDEDGTVTSEDLKEQSTSSPNDVTADIVDSSDVVPLSPLPAGSSALEELPKTPELKKPLEAPTAPLTDSNDNARTTISLPPAPESPNITSPSESPPIPKQDQPSAPDVKKMTPQQEPPADKPKAEVMVGPLQKLGPTSITNDNNLPEIPKLDGQTPPEPLKKPAQEPKPLPEKPTGELPVPITQTDKLPIPEQESTAETLPIEDKKEDDNNQLPIQDTTELESQTEQSTNSINEQIRARLQEPESKPQKEAMPPEVKPTTTPEPIKPQAKNKPPSRIDKFTNEVAKKGTKEKELETIKKEEFEDSEEKQALREQEAKELQFISNETKLLLFPNDQVVLGQLDYNGYLETLNYWQLFPLIEKEIAYLQNAPARRKLDNFLTSYNENFTEDAYFSPEDLESAYVQAVEAIIKNDVYRLQVILDSYPILQIPDADGNNLLHFAAYHGRYEVAKLLTMKGININSINKHSKTPLDISRKRNFDDITNLIIKAGG